MTGSRSEPNPPLSLTCSCLKQQSWDATHRGLAEELATAKRAASEAEATARGLEEELGLLKGRLAAAGEEQARAVAAAAESEHELNVRVCFVCPNVGYGVLAVILTTSHAQQEEIAALQVRMEEQAEAHEQALAAAKAEQELQVCEEADEGQYDIATWIGENLP